VRKELIRPDRSEIPAKTLFRFTHILIRDAAYSGIPKATRVALHERLADWIDVNTRKLAGEYEEIVWLPPRAGASRSDRARSAPPPRRRAGRSGGRASGVSRRARLRAWRHAGRRQPALARDAAPAPPPSATSELLPDVAFSLLETADFDRLVAVAQEMEEAAAATGDPGVEVHAIVIASGSDCLPILRRWPPEAESEARRAHREPGRRLGDERRASPRAWSLLGLVGNVELTIRAPRRRPGRRQSSTPASRKIAARRSTVWPGRRRRCGSGRALPTEGIRRCREILDRSQGDRKGDVERTVLAGRSSKANLGRFDKARGALRPG
jgi:hypothetical protein